MMYWFLPHEQAPSNVPSSIMTSRSSPTMRSLSIGVGMDARWFHAFVGVHEVSIKLEEG